MEAGADLMTNSLIRSLLLERDLRPTMIQTCNDEYWKHMENLKPEGAPCGRVFDDVNHWTFCPHNYFPPSDLKPQGLEDL